MLSRCAAMCVSTDALEPGQHQRRFPCSRKIGCRGVQERCSGMRSSPAGLSRSKAARVSGFRPEGSAIAVPLTECARQREANGGSPRRPDGKAMVGFGAGDGHAALEHPQAIHAVAAVRSARRHAANSRIAIGASGSLPRKSLSKRDHHVRRDRTGSAGLNASPKAAVAAARSACGASGSKGTWTSPGRTRLRSSISAAASATARPR